MEMNRTAREAQPQYPTSSGVLPETSTTTPTETQHPEPCDWLLHSWSSPAIRFPFSGRILCVVGERVTEQGVVVLVKIQDPENGRTLGFGIIPLALLEQADPNSYIKEQLND